MNSPVLRLVLLTVVGAAALCGAGVPLLAGENYAFLVAVGDYDRKELRPLQFTRNDIIELNRILLDSGYDKANIVLMHDDPKNSVGRRFFPEAAKIREELKLLLAGLDGDDTLVVAFAGHGVQFRGDKQNYFCPADAKLDDRNTLLSMSELYRSLEKCPVRQKLLLVDACRDDPQSALSRARQTIELESVTRPQTEATPEGLIAVFSCAAGQRSFEDPDLKHGIFFYHVLEAWKGTADDGDDELTLDELVSFTKKKTQAVARTSLAVIQTPQQVGEFTGTWVLRRLKPDSPKPDSPKPTPVKPTPAPPITKLPDPTKPPSGRPLPPGSKPATPKNEEGFFVNSVGLEMIQVRSALYLRGSPESDGRSYGHERPAHTVEITRDFHIGVYEVSQGEWMAVMKTEPWKGQENAAEGRGLAASYVSWEDAAAFCRELTRLEGREYRLPTEAEWEYACRAGSTTVYSFGDDPKAIGEFARHGGVFDEGNTVGQRHAGACGTKKPNRFGLFDMHGNVKEWCSDWHDPKEYSRFADKVAVDPQGPPAPLPDRKERVVRGGSWREPDYMLRSAQRSSNAPTYRFSDLGFRVVAPALVERPPASK